jgi:triacylglycerol lipase
MKSRLSILVIAAIIITPSLLSTSGSTLKCDTKYPVVLAHSFSLQAKVFNIIDYFWGVQTALNDEGAEVYITSVNGMDSVVNKAVSFKRQYLEILAISGSSKANIIGHSQGGLYTRYAISNLGLGTKVASHTSLNSPHRGSSVADWVFKIVPQNYWTTLGDACDFVYTFVIGDKNPQSLTNGLELTRPFMQNVFNPATPNISGIYYQSYTSKVKYLSSSLFLQVPWMICSYYEGDNDGLVAVSSAKWGNFRGVQSGAW